MSALRSLDSYKCIVVKIGSATLVDEQEGRLRTQWLTTLAADLAWLTNKGANILIVSSGAIALGRQNVDLPAGTLKLEESQAAAAIGQIALAQAWSETLNKHGLTAGQVLLTLGDTEAEKRHYLNARATIRTLFALNAIPIINENDTVATSEIRYGDNDRLAARVASMVSADCLVLLSDIDGLYTAPPAKDPKAEHLPLIKHITPEIEAMAGESGSALAKGGMTTKLAAAKIAMDAGAAMVIANGAPDHPLRRIADGAKSTWFLPASEPQAVRKRWIAGHLKPKGALSLDAGAVRALKSGKSLLPAGVRAVIGTFDRGDNVAILAPDGREIGRGLVAYDNQDASKIAGQNSREIEAILGYAGRTVMIHRDNMALVLQESLPDGTHPDSKDTTPATDSQSAEKAGTQECQTAEKAGPQE